MHDRLTEYRKMRREDPYLPARYVLPAVTRAAIHEEARESRLPSSYSDGPLWRLTREGFEITVSAEVESQCPMPGDGYGEYVDASRYSEHDSPREPTPMDLPAAHFRWGGNRNNPEYFFPEYVEDQFDSYRKMGASKSVARDLIVAWIEKTISEMHGLTYWNVRVTVEREGIELGSASMGTTTLEDGEDYLLEMADEYSMIEEAIDEARANLAKLAQVV